MPRRLPTDDALTNNLQHREGVPHLSNYGVERRDFNAADFWADFAGRYR
jgi:hypothetical protein